jgi:hypothetical protein
MAARGSRRGDSARQLHACFLHHHARGRRGRSLAIPHVRLSGQQPLFDVCACADDDN